MHRGKRAREIIKYLMCYYGILNHQNANADDNLCNTSCSLQATECAGKLMHRRKRAWEVIKYSKV